MEDKLFVIFAHHTIGSTKNGDQLRTLLLKYPNVILMVNGHTHSNRITPHKRPDGSRIEGGFWEVSSAWHIDWPIQSRIVDIAAGAALGTRRTISIFTTVVDFDSRVGLRRSTERASNNSGCL